MSSKKSSTGIHIKPSHEGDFTAKANAAGMGVQAYASKVLNAPEGQYDPSTRRQANFAHNAASWNHAMGGNMYAKGGSFTNSGFMALPKEVQNKIRSRAFADGGPMAQLTEFNNGGVHEENPLGGIPQGTAPDGRVNLVEQGETKLNSDNYIFSNALTIDKATAEEFALSKADAGKTFADVSKKLNRPNSRRENDTIEQIAIKRDLDNLMNAQEAFKQKEVQKKLEEIQSLDPNALSQVAQSYQPQGMPAQGAPQGMEQDMGQEQMPQGQPSPEEMMMMEQQGQGQPQMDPAMMQQMMAQQQGASEMPMQYGGPMSYKCGGSMYDFGGNLMNARSYEFGGAQAAQIGGQVLSTFGTLAGSIPGIGTAVGAAAGGLGKGLTEIGNQKAAGVEKIGWGEVAKNVGLGAASGATGVIGAVALGAADKALESTYDDPIEKQQKKDALALSQNPNNPALLAEAAERQKNAATTGMINQGIGAVGGAIGGQLENSAVDSTMPTTVVPPGALPLEQLNNGTMSPTGVVTNKYGGYQFANGGTLGDPPANLTPAEQLKLNQNYNSTSGTPLKSGENASISPADFAAMQAGKNFATYYNPVPVNTYVPAMPAKNSTPEQVAYMVNEDPMGKSRWVDQDVYNTFKGNKTKMQLDSQGFPLMGASGARYKEYVDTRALQTPVTFRDGGPMNYPTYKDNAGPMGQPLTNLYNSGGMFNNFGLGGDLDFNSEDDYIDYMSQDNAILLNNPWNKQSVEENLQFNLPATDFEAMSSAEQAKYLSDLQAADETLKDKNLDLTMNQTWGQAAGMALPAAYNLGQGLFGKVGTLRPEDYYQKADFKGQTYNDNPERQMIQDTYSQFSDATRNAAPGGGAYLTALQNLSRSRNESLSTLARNKQEREMASAQDAQIRNKAVEAGNKGVKANVDDYNIKAKEAKRQMLAAGLGQIADIAKGSTEMDTQTAYMKAIAPDFAGTFNYNTKFDQLSAKAKKALLDKKNNNKTV